MSKTPHGFWNLKPSLFAMWRFYTDHHVHHVRRLVGMERWSVQHRIAAVKMITKTKFVTAKKRGLQQQLQRRDAPSRDTLLLWVSKWRQEGSVKDIKLRGWPRSAPTPENVERVRDAILWSPRRSARRRPLALRSQDSCLRRIFSKKLRYGPHKIQVAQT